MTESEITRLIHPERAKLIPVTGTNDQADLQNAVDVQFNPTTLKVSMSNTLKENQRSGGSRSAQYVDKSSSSLSVELIFDTTYIDEETEQLYQERVSREGRTMEAVAVGSDVRLLTKRIAERFIKPKGTGQRMQAPDRCLFQWGAFEFIGLVESYEETLDFFSPEGRPLRATVSLKLSEDRFQFRQQEVEQAERETPALSSTGNPSDARSEERGEDTGASAPPAPQPPSQSVQPVNRGSASEQRNWRDTALYNGVESPRLPQVAVLAHPKVSASASLKLGAGVSLSAAVSAGSSTKNSFPAFRFGASASLGTGIRGAFSSSADSGLAAGGLLSGGVRLRGDDVVSSIETQAEARRTGDSGVGFE